MFKLKQFQNVINGGKFLLSMHLCHFDPNFDK